MYYLKKHIPEVVPAGMWARKYEKDLGVSLTKWNQLALGAKAALESRLQVIEYVYLQFEMHWVEFYAPQVVNKDWIHLDFFSRKAQKIYKSTFRRERRRLVKSSS